MRKGNLAILAAVERRVADDEADASRAVAERAADEIGGGLAGGAGRLASRTMSVMATRVCGIDVERRVILVYAVAGLLSGRLGAAHAARAIRGQFRQRRRRAAGAFGAAENRALAPNRAPL